LEQTSNQLHLKHIMAQIAKRQILILLLNSIGFILVLIVNYLANAIPLGGMNTGAVSELYPNLFVPAGFTFAIWGVIYLALLVMLADQWYIFFFRKAKSSYLLKGVWFFISCIANASWIIAWHYQYTCLSLVIMLVLLISLLNLYTDVRSDIPPYYLTAAPISLYTAWITVATVANTTAWLVNISWDGFGIYEAYWASILIFTASGIGLAMCYKFNDLAWAAVVLWALWGIRTARVQENNPENASIIISTYICMGLMILLGIYVGKKKWQA
jgi:hypothetical protein